MGMMPSAPIDASQVHMAMPMPVPMPMPPPPPPPRSKSSAIEIMKLVTGLFIVLVLAAILIVLIFVPRTGNTVDSRESNENIAKLERESNENVAKLGRESNEDIARLQREQELALAKEQQKNQNQSIEEQFRREMKRMEHQENLTERYRFEDRILTEQHRREDAQRAVEQFRLQLEIEQRRFELLLEERKLAEQHREEDRERENTDLIFKFLDDVIYTSPPMNRMRIEARVQSLLRRFDPPQKSFLIDNLYKANLLMAGDPNNPPLNLRGANLRALDFDGTNDETDESSLTSFYFFIR